MLLYFINHVTFAMDENRLVISDCRVTLQSPDIALHATPTYMMSHTCDLVAPYQVISQERCSNFTVPQHLCEKVSISENSEEREEEKLKRKKEMKCVSMCTC